MSNSTNNVKIIKNSGRVRIKYTMQIFCQIFQSNIPCSLKCSYSSSPGTFQFNTEMYILYINVMNLDNYIIYNFINQREKVSNNRD